MKSRFQSSIALLGLLLGGRAAADTVGRCAGDSMPGDYFERGGERIWCAQEGLWNAIPVLFAFFHPMSGWIPLIGGVVAIVVGGMFTGRRATTTGWLSRGGFLNITHHPAVPGSSSFVLRLIGALLTLAGFVLLAIGAMLLIVR
jgi:hypothetical protein